MNKLLKAKDYRKIFFLYGIIYATIPIIIVEIIWDGLANSFGISEGLLRELIGSFFRAALIEEVFKFFAFMKANKKYNFSNEKEYMLGAGMIGLAYGIIEKVATGNAMAIILGILFPMHILWQMNQGRHFYKYKKANAENDNKKAKKELLLATLIIYLIHGSWDALISLVQYFADTSKVANADIFGAILLGITILFGIIYIIVSIIKIRKVLKNNKDIDSYKA